MEHTKGKLIHRGTTVFFGDSLTVGGFDIRNCPSPEANARRLVACWNACEGIDTETLEATSREFRGTIPVGYMAVPSGWCKDRDELTEKLRAAEDALVTAQIERDDFAMSLRELLDAEMDDSWQRHTRQLVARAAANALLDKVKL